MAENNSLLLLDYVGEKSNIALITFNRQKALNAFNDKMLDGLSSLLKSLKENKTVRAIILFAKAKAGQLVWISNGLRLLVGEL